MPKTLTGPDFTGMLKAAVAKVEAEVATLSRLDSVCGDGDHGTTMKRALTAAVTAAAGAPQEDLPGVVEAAAWAVMSTDGGATCPLFGSFFMGMAEGLKGAGAPDASGTATAFEAGLAALRKQTPAQPGDKTMIDAMIPAVEALRKASASGADLGSAFASAADAAEAGAKATAPLRAKLGRARNLGERSVGSPDPGATSVGLIFRAFAEALK